MILQDLFLQSSGGDLSSSGENRGMTAKSCDEGESLVGVSCVFSVKPYWASDHWSPQIVIPIGRPYLKTPGRRTDRYKTRWWFQKKQPYLGK